MALEYLLSFLFVFYNEKASSVFVFFSIFLNITAIVYISLTFGEL
jgi:hypothetical protein